MTPRTGSIGRQPVAPINAGTGPQVSIVVATYNLSGSLRWTIESALRQTMTDWEMLVVGDACTDDTADVVASFGDDRISFLNLHVNCGDQAGPNNVGVHRTHGQLDFGVTLIRLAA